MKICTKCIKEKSETEFYIDYKSKTLRQVSECKVCKSEREKNRRKNKSKIKYNSVIVGNKLCTKCNIEKNILEFGVDHGLPNGRQIHCKICTQIKSRSRKRRFGKIYLPPGTIDDGSYLTGVCEVCEEKFSLLRKNHKRCKVCSILVKNIQITLSTLRISKKTTKCNPAKAVLMAKRFKSAISCCYCGQNFNEFITKSIDHIVPLALNGSNEVDNLCICCLQCNLSKRDLSFKKWIDLCRLVVQTYDSKH